MRRGWTWHVIVLAALLVAVPFAPAGDKEAPHDARTSSGRIVGQLTLLLLGASLLTAGARRTRSRGLVHVGLGLMILVACVVHALVLLASGLTHGWLSGALALALLAAHGAAGLAKGALVRRWGRGGWRAAHLASGIGALTFALEHALLYGRHWGVLRGLLPG